MTVVGVDDVRGKGLRLLVRLLTVSLFLQQMKRRRSVVLVTVVAPSWPRIETVVVAKGNYPSSAHKVP